MAQSQDPPLLAGSRVFIVQPGVRAIVALEPDSGRRLWRKVSGTVRRLIDVVGERLIVQTDEGLLALDTSSGKTLWQYDERNMLDAILCGGDGGILIARREQVKGEINWRPVLVWLKPETGEETARTVLETLKHERPKFGPLIVGGGKLWGFFGRNEQDPGRDIVELVPKGKALAKERSGDDLGRWARHVDPALRSATPQVLDRWTLIDAQLNPAAGLVSEWQGERDVLNTIGSAGHPVRLARQVKLPAGGHPKLALRVANDPAGKWKLDVRVAGKTLLEQTVDQAATGGQWKNLEVDLSPYAGTTVWLIVRQIDEGGPQPFAKWKRLDVVF
jgi:hypothetical protein